VRRISILALCLFAACGMGAVISANAFAHKTPKAIEQELKEKKERLAALKAEETRLLQKIEKDATELAELIAAQSSTNAALNELRSELKEADEIAACKPTFAEEVASELFGIPTKCTKREEKFEQEHGQTLEEYIKSLEATIKKLEAELAKIPTLSAEEEALKKKLSAVEGEVAALEREIADLERELVELHPVHFGSNASDSICVDPKDGTLFDNPPEEDEATRVKSGSFAPLEKTDNHSGPLPDSGSACDTAVSETLYTEGGQPGGVSGFKYFNSNRGHTQTVYNSSLPEGTWISPFPEAKDQYPGHENYPPQYYIYDTTFNLLCRSDPEISGTMLADNAAAAFLNGKWIGRDNLAWATDAQEEQEQSENFNDPGFSFGTNNRADFKAGTNVLQFVVLDYSPKFTGVDFESTVSRGNCPTVPVWGPAIGTSKVQTMSWGTLSFKFTHSTLFHGEGEGGPSEYTEITCKKSDAGNVWNAENGVGLDETVLLDFYECRGYENTARESRLCPEADVEVTASELPWDSELEEVDHVVRDRSKGMNVSLRCRGTGELDFSGELAPAVVNGNPSYEEFGVGSGTLTGTVGTLEVRGDDYFADFEDDEPIRTEPRELQEEEPGTGGTKGNGSNTNIEAEAAAATGPNTAVFSADVDPEGAEVTDCEFEYGTEASGEATVPCSALPEASEGAVPVSAAITRLAANTTYHFRVTTSNANGTSTGAEQTFATPSGAPSVATNPAPEETRASVELSGTVNPEGAPVTACEFEYGTTTSYGSSATCTPAPGGGSEAVRVSVSVAGLTPRTTYHFRISATNANGTVADADETFKTLAQPAPTVITKPGSAVTRSSATLNGIVDPSGGEVTKCEFEYGSTNSYGASVPCSSLPGSGTSPVDVSASVTGLEEGTEYHFRILATNDGGTSEGSDESFDTEGAPPTVTKLKPTSGPAGGGTAVTITGTGFTEVVAVKFGTASATSVHVVSTKSLTAVSPAGTGAVKVTVVTAGGTSAVGAKDEFKYKK
jgi:IPT/TIG domain